MTGVTHCHTSSELDHCIQQTVLQPKQLLLVDFYTTWCGPCKAIAPKLDDMQQLFGPEGLVIVKVDLEEVTSAPGDFSVSMMPTFVLFQEGEEVGRVVGADLNKLRRTVLDQLSGKSK